MNSIIQMRKFVAEHPAGTKAAFFRELLDSIEHDKPVSMAGLYELDYRDFELALETLRDWRLHRYAEMSVLSPVH